MKKKRVVILGASGQLGSFLSNSCSWPPDFEIITLKHSDLDISSQKSMNRFFNQSEPFHCLINAAAFMPVDKAETYPEISFKTNGFSLLPLAKLCQAQNCFFVHFSTDYVFDGKKKSPYTEDDGKNPLNIYGASKHIGEIILKNMDFPYIILRTSWLYSSLGHNFLKKIWEWSFQDRVIKIVDDQIGCPTFSEDIVETVISLVSSFLEKPYPEKCGVFNLYGAGETSWYGFATYILSIISSYRKTNLRLIPVRSVTYHAAVAKRPLYSVLDCEKIKLIHGIEQKDWKERTSFVIEELESSFESSKLIS